MNFSNLASKGQSGKSLQLAVGEAMGVPHTVQWTHLALYLYTCTPNYAVYINVLTIGQYLYKSTGDVVCLECIIMQCFRGWLSSNR